MKYAMLLFCFILLIGTAPSVSAASDGTITKEELREVIDDPDLVIIDVRTGRDWRSSEFKIKGAVRANLSEFDKWVAQLSKDKQYVTYCA